MVLHTDIFFIKRKCSLLPIIVTIKDKELSRSRFLTHFEYYNQSILNSQSFVNISSNAVRSTAVVEDNRKNDQSKFSVTSGESRLGQKHRPTRSNEERLFGVITYT